MELLRKSILMGVFILILSLSSCSTLTGLILGDNTGSKSTSSTYMKTANANSGTSSSNNAPVVAPTKQNKGQTIGTVVFFVILFIIIFGVIRSAAGEKTNRTAKESYQSTGTVGRDNTAREESTVGKDESSNNSDSKSDDTEEILKYFMYESEMLYVHHVMRDYSSMGIINKPADHLKWIIRIVGADLERSYEAILNDADFLEILDNIMKEWGFELIKGPLDFNTDFARGEIYWLKRINANQEQTNTYNNSSEEHKTEEAEEDDTDEDFTDDETRRTTYRFQYSKEECLRILGLQDDWPSREEARKRYRDLVKENHTDNLRNRFPNLTEEEYKRLFEEKTERMKEINTAYEEYMRYLNDHESEAA